ncbi:ABC transporter permease [Streptomyces sp. NBC_01498]|uniref:ABC transporter permease n=1 Tax=Streptomyces sp. NBC_01498 TaxID=2975870 RepID=UPI002E7BABC4|nr:ABC transporter permease [Streptomyces sp. NBC_01498]WTL25337.1 ABC transporter permease [Streptomyces sp. NBC_01498]
MEGTIEQAAKSPAAQGAAARGGAQRVLVLTGRYGTPGVLVLLLIGFTAAGPTFLTGQNLLNILNQSATLAVVAGGLTLPLVAGKFDLSFAAVVSLSGILAVGFLERGGLPWFAAILLALAAAGIIGLVNGLLVAQLRIDPIVATLGTSTMLLGLNYAYSSGTPITLDSGPFTEIARGSVLGVPAPVILAAAVLGGLWVALNFTLLGHHMRAVGTNQVAARMAGVRVARITVIAFVICGLCAGLAGVLLSARIGSGQVTAGDGYLLNAFAAVFLGASVVRDGEFHIVGTLVGVLIVTVTFNGLSLLGAESYVQFLFQGGILVAATALSSTSRRMLLDSARR